MKNLNSLKVLYGLEYDKSNYNSSLINWYNRLINKSINKLTVSDVSKMIRQNILVAVALERAIELFFIDPFDGEMQDGDLLDLITLRKDNIVTYKQKNLLYDKILEVENKFHEFEWSNQENKELFEKNIITLKEVLSPL